MLRAYFNVDISTSWSDYDLFSGVTSSFGTDSLVDFDCTLDMPSSSAASFQLPRMSATMKMVPKELEGMSASLWEYFTQNAKKGDLVHIWSENAVVDPIFWSENFPKDAHIYMTLDSWSCDEDTHVILANLTSIDIDKKELVQWGGRLLPAALTDEAYAELSLKNISRLPYTVEGNRNTVCLSSADDALLALAWGFDNKRHNISFEPVKGVQESGKVLLVPSPSSPVDGIPRYCIDPKDIIDKTTQQPELNVTDLLTGSLVTNTLVPIITPQAAVSALDDPLKTAVKLYTSNGKHLAYSVKTGRDSSTGVVDYIVLEGKQTFLENRVYQPFGITKAKVLGSYDVPIDAYYLLNRDGSTTALTPDGRQTSGPNIGSYTVFDLSAMNNFSTFNEYVLDEETGTSIFLIPQGDNYFVVKTLDANGVPSFVENTVSLAFSSLGYNARPIGVLKYTQSVTADESHPDGKAPYFGVLIVPSNKNLSNATVLTAPVDDPTTGSGNPLPTVSLPAEAVQDWTQVEYINFGVIPYTQLATELSKYYVVYTVPNATTGEKIICVQVVDRETNTTPLYTFQADSTFIGVHASSWDTPLYVVGRNSYYRFDLTTVDGNWFKLLSFVPGTDWGTLDEMYNGMQNTFVVSKTVTSTDTQKTRTVYFMQGDDPFALTSLGNERVQNSILTNVTYNPREIACVIDPCNLENENAIPKLGKKLQLKIASFKYKTKSTDDWTSTTVDKLSLPMLGGLCKVKTTDDEEYKVAIISQINVKFDGYIRETVTLSYVDTQTSL